MLRTASSWQRCWRQCSTMMHTSGTTPHSRRLLQSIANTILDRFRSAQRGGTGDTSAPSSWSKSMPSSSSSEMIVAAGSSTRRFCHYGLIFTCSICEKRAGKAVSKIAYDKGVVIVQCEGCGNRHLIADRLGWFGEPGSIEDFIQNKDLSVSKYWKAGSFEISPEDADGLREVYDHLSTKPKR